MAKRTRYQYGSVEINKRVTGPDVWLYRWWEPTSDGRRTRRGFTVGTVEKYKTEAHALKAAEGMRLMINDGMLRRDPVLFCGILDRFLLDQKQEVDAEQITHNTLASYRSMICQHIRPKWGDAHLKDVRPTLVQDWLRRLDLSPKYKGHIRSLMYRLFDKAMLWELLEVDRNPMDLVEVKGISKRKKRPCVLQVKDAWQMLDALVQPFRTIVLIGLCFGLRISEILGLRWTDIRFQAIGGSGSTISGRKAAQQVEDGVFAGRGSNRTGLYPRTQEMASALSRYRRALAFPEPGDGSTVSCRLDAQRLPGSYRSEIGTWQDRVSHVPSHISCLAGRDRSTRGRTAETHATRARLNHNGTVRQCLGLGQAQSQAPNRATPLAKTCESRGLHSINKGNCEADPLIGQFWTVAASAQWPVTL